MTVPFFKPSITEAEIAEVTDALRSGWLTSGPRTRAFEQDFAAAVGARHAVALNSGTAALHLALEALGTRRGDLVLVPTMTFAATAEVVRYFDATPVLVDCDPRTLCIDAAAAARTLAALRDGQPVAGLRPPYGPVRAVMPVHYGGQMADVAAVRALGLPVVEDAAHALPAAARVDGVWRSVGTTGDVTCFSFYANKCITTGEGGMAVTDDEALATRMRLMSLHGLSKDAWARFTAEGSWYYEITAPGFKYNMTDVAAALGLVQLRRAEELLAARRRIAGLYAAALAGHDLVLPEERPDRRHAWHLYAVQLGPSWPARERVLAGLRAAGIGFSVHWMPLHLHPYYRETYGLGPGLFPVAEAVWPRLVSLPIYPGMSEAEVAEASNALVALRREGD